MNKIGIVTFVRPCNYGAALQCYALNATIKKLGGEPMTMNYWPEYFRIRYYMPKPPFSLRPSKFKTWRQLSAVKKVKDARNKKFEQFQNEHFNLSSSLSTNAEELSQNVAKTGIKKWITGSDQVWSPTCARFDPSYFLDFPMPSDCKKYSYAASFGASSLPDDMKEEYKRRLTGYERYSVREHSGVDIVNELIDVKPEVHCDPTLLLSQEEWNKIASPAREEKYILIYHVSRPERLLKHAKALREKTGYKVILFTPYFSYPAIKGHIIQNHGYEAAMDSSPADFVSLFKNAEYVLTNSFHGTVFSVIYHKKFWSQTAFIEGGLNTRAINLLDKLGITGRDVDAVKPLADTPIDWEKSDEALNKMRKEAIDYLSAVLSDPLS